MISVLSIVHDTMVDGPGFRTSIYCAGCPNACPGCHNPQSWDIHHGTMMETGEILCEIQPEGFLALAKAIKAETKKTIWCYSGFVFENLLQNERQKALLQYVDVLVDGPYIEAQRDTDLIFRGSRNQRLIDVKRSLEEGVAVLLDYHPMDLGI